MYVYSLISHQVQQTSQCAPLVLELSLIRSHLIWEEFREISTANATHNSPLSFHQVPITAKNNTIVFYQLVLIL